MPTFAHTSATDPLGLATDNVIVLTDQNGGDAREHVEVLNAAAQYVTAATTAIKIRTEGRSAYELLATARLVVDFGVAINTHYIATGLTAQYTSEGYPTAEVTWIKFSAIAKYLATGSGQITLTGGFGLVEKFGATFAQGISSRLSVSMMNSEAMAETSGDFLDAGYTHYGLKCEYTVEAYDAITIPAGAVPAGTDSKTGRTAWGTFSKSWFTYL
jgi:hypothetical protein